MITKKFALGSACLVAALHAGPRADAKELYWSGFEVRAKIDGAGVLHVRERQNIVFDGDWNGGYRAFSLRTRQKLDFERLLRIDSATGREVLLAPGDLSQVDQYKWTDPTTLRWRSRLPSDPAFDHREIDYVLEYRLSNVIRRMGETYVLDHDFAFPDREGRIEKFAVDLDVDPAWRVEGDVARHFEASNLPPGRGFVVAARLSRVAPGRAAGTLDVLSGAAKIALLAAGLAFFLYLFADFVARERASGRLSPISRRDPDRAWLAEKIFSWKPEEVGAAWSDSVGRAEVAAIVSRLAGAGKLSFHVEKAGLLSHPVLHMKLLADHASFAGYERPLVDGLFFGGRTETDTDSIRKHYASSGFDPASRMRNGLEGAVASRRGMSGSRPAPAKTRTLAITAAAAILLVLSAATHYGEGGFIPAVVFDILLLGGPAIALAASSRRVVDGFPVRVGIAGVLVLLAAYAPFLYLGYGLSAMFVAGWVAAAMAAASAAFNLARSRETDQKIGRRREFETARRFFVRELSKRSPALEDSWVPYLLAFGLNRRVESWFGSFGSAAAGAAFGAAAASSAGASSASSSPAPFTGGGGAFGGAGASAAWIGAVGALSAGVSSPSSGSSGGGGGGGGGGGSSGGGGGGGW